MEEADLLIKELRIDNESLLSSNYNPLLQVFENKMSFRNTYHRVEKVMEGIINLTYKGFSDSVLSYMEIYNLNNNNITRLNKIMNLLDGIQSSKVSVENIRQIFNTTKYLKCKSDVVSLLVEVDESMSSDIFKAKDLIKDNKLYFIEGIDLLRNEINKEIDRLMYKIFSKVQEWIYKDKIEYKDLIRNIKVHDKVKEFDKFLLDNFLRFPTTSLVNDKIKYLNGYFEYTLSVTNKVIKKEEIFDNEEDNKILLLDDEYFTKVNYANNTLLFYNNNALLFYNNNNISNSSINIIINRIKEIFKNKQINYYLINTLVQINKKYNTERMSLLINKYTKIMADNIKEEILYLFDIFYREGCYENDYYIKKIVNVINKNTNIIEYDSKIVEEVVDNLNKYIKNKSITDKLKEKIYLLDEILGEYTDKTINLI